MTNPCVFGPGGRQMPDQPNAWIAEHSDGGGGKNDAEKPVQAASAVQGEQSTGVRRSQQAGACSGGSVYRVGWTTRADLVREAQKLRYRVFYEELGCGNVPASRLDRDEFDGLCEHLLVQSESGEIVGTYRLLRGAVLSHATRFFSGRDFEMEPYENYRSQIVEVGRFCVHPAHRNGCVLRLLRSGVRHFARMAGARYLIGCNSLFTSDTSAARAVFARLEQTRLAPPHLRTRPHPAIALPLHGPVSGKSVASQLFKFYYRMGALVCAPPAVDRKFGTIDFLTVHLVDNFDPNRCPPPIPSGL